MIRIFIFISWLLSFSPLFSQHKSILFIGGYTQTGSHGIYVAIFDESTGTITLIDSASCSNPSYLVQSYDGKMVYAIDEITGVQGGDVSAFFYDKEKHSLQFLNKQASGGDHPCFVDIHPEGKWLAAANYTGGSFSLLPVLPNGQIERAALVIQHEGNGPNLQRQEKPHVHQTIFTNKGKYLWVNDLGIDQVHRYDFFSKKLSPVNEKSKLTIKTDPGAGPRHLTVHSRLPVMYVLSELDGMVNAYKMSKKSASLIQKIKSDEKSKQPGCADIHLSPDGRFLYTSNRAEANSVSIFTVNQQTGQLEKIGEQSTLGLTPRNFVVHPSGNWLLVANQNSGNIVVFKRDQVTGLLTPVNTPFNLPSPSCLVFAR